VVVAPHGRSIGLSRAEVSEGSLDLGKEVAF
jgi:hypothetical protein